MPDTIRHSQPLRLAWALWGFMLLSLPLLITATHLRNDWLNDLLGPGNLVFLRSALYLLSFAILLGMKNLRASMLKPLFRENRSTPLPQAFNGTACYLKAVIASLLLAEFIAIFGLLLFLLGDTVHSLYIFTGLSAMTMLLYRPTRNELVGAEI